MRGAGPSPAFRLAARAGVERW